MFVFGFIVFMVGGLVVLFVGIVWGLVVVLVVVVFLGWKVMMIDWFR